MLRALQLIFREREISIYRVSGSQRDCARAGGPSP
jgi:hypothetical protein